MGDAFAGPEVLATVDGERLILQAEDHYRFDLTRSIRVGIALQVEAGASVALVLWDDATGQVVQLAYTPLASLTTISAVLSAGGYRIGVIAMETPNGRVRYTLGVDAN